MAKDKSLRNANGMKAASSITDNNGAPKAGSHN